MLSRFQRGTLVASRRNICGRPAKKNKKKELKPCPDKRKKYNQCTFNDPKYFWLESQICEKRKKTWQEVEEEVACLGIYGCSRRVQPSRILFCREEGDFEICRRGCLHPCTPPPCEDDPYPSPAQYLLNSIKNVITASIFFGLLYFTYRLHIWESSSGTIGAILGDPDETIDNVGHKLIGFLKDKWNKIVATMFVGIKKILIHMELQKQDGFNECEFFIKVEDGVRNVYEAMKKHYRTIKCGITIEANHVFQEWELVYNYKQKPVQEEACDLGWKWMDHPETGFISDSLPIIPYESVTKELIKKERKKAKLASVYSDICSQWKVDPNNLAEENECDDPNSRAAICKRKYERKYKTKINPSNCKCPISSSSIAQNEDDQ